MRLCRFHPAALEEADNAAAFYKAQQPDLEVRFLEALNDAVSRIRSNPFLYRCVAGDVRKCRIVHFPYGVIYRVGENGIQVIAIMHIRRQPGYWKLRI